MNFEFKKGPYSSSEYMLKPVNLVLIGLHVPTPAPNDSIVSMVTKRIDLMHFIKNGPVAINQSINQSIRLYSQNTFHTL